MTAPEQAPATVPREFWDLLHEWAESPSEERRDAIEHRFGELFALASRLSAPPAPQGEPVAEWEYRLQDRRGNWLPWALCTEAYERAYAKGEHTWMTPNFGKPTSKPRRASGRITALHPPRC